VVTTYRGWTVHETVSHLIGAASGHASVRESKRQAGQVRKHQEEFGSDGATARTSVHIEEYAALPPAQMIFRLRSLAPRAIDGRQRRESWFGPAHKPPAYGNPNLGTPGLSLAEMCNVSLARDVWLHRFDIAEATGHDPVYNDDIDGAVLAGVVAEWCERHGQPVDLELTDPFGGHFVSGEGGPHIKMDALDFCRVVAGRKPVSLLPLSPLLETRVPF
jgi:uncharacterized protein (TIGR03083 family)